jgi:hypothetical protein
VADERDLDAYWGEAAEQHADDDPRDGHVDHRPDLRLWAMTGPPGEDVNDSPSF